MVSARLLLSGSALLFVEMVLAVTKGERRVNAAPASREAGGQRISTAQQSVTPARA